MSGIYEKGKSETSLLEKIMLFVPGFRGYKEKEMRRESDRLVRTKVHQTLEEARIDFKQTYSHLVDSQVTEAWKEGDSLVAVLDRVSERINHGESGYAGFFNILKVREPDLDRMIQFDMKLLEESKKIRDAVTTLKAEVDEDKFSSARSKIMGIRKQLDALEKTYDTRREVILGAE